MTAEERRPAGYGSPITLWRSLARILRRPRLWLTDRENLLFVALIVLHLVPLWSFKYFPSQDGPAHLANATIIREYHHPDATAFREYYVLNEHLTPNWIGHLVLAGLMSLMPMLVAEKVFLSGYVILLPVAVRYAVAAVRPQSTFLAVLAFPFVYNYLFHLGFFSFSYSLPMFFLVSGYWLKHRERFTLRDTIILAALSLLLYFGHIVSTVTALLEIVLMATWLMLLEAPGQIRERGFSLGALRNALPIWKPVWAFAPTMILYAIFTSQNRQLGSSLSLSWEDKPPLKTLLKQLASVYSLASYEEREVWIAGAVAGLFVAVIVYALSRRVPLRLTFWDGFVLVAVVYAIIYLVGPSEIGGGSYIHDRMNLYPFLVLIIWFAAHAYGPVARRSIQVLAIGIAGLLLGLHSVKYGELNDYIEEYLSGMPRIEPNRTLLPIYFSQRGDAPGGRPLLFRIDLFVNAAGYIAAERHIIDLGNYEAGQTSHFPTLFRPELNPAVHLHYAPLDRASGELRGMPTEILGYPRQTGGRIDYVLVWGARDRYREKETPKTILRQLHAGYDLIYTSSQRGLMQLYRRKDLKNES